MTALVEQIYRTIQELPIEDKVQLVDKLLFSLTPASPGTNPGLDSRIRKKIAKI